MKNLMLVFLMLAPLPALVEAREATDIEHQWHKLQMLLAEDDAALQDHMAFHDVHFQDIPRLKSYVVASNEAIKEALAPKVAAMCADRESLTKDPELLIPVLRDIFDTEKAAIDEAVRGLAEAVGEADALAFQHLAAHSKRTKVIEPDFIDLVRSPNFDAAALLDSNCSGVVK